MEIKKFLMIDLDELCAIWTRRNHLGVKIKPNGKIKVDYVRFNRYLSRGRHRINWFRYVILLMRFRMMHYGDK